MTGLVRLPETTEPITPPAGKIYLYVDQADGEVAVKKDDGSVQKFLAAVDSINGFTGTVVLDTDNVAEGSINFYYTEGRFDASLAGKTTDDLTEGATNLYFTAAEQAKLAGIETGAQVNTVDTVNGQTGTVVIPAPLLSATFTSSDQVITSGGPLTIPHGLGVVPKIVMAQLVCTAADHGYSIGDVIEITVGQTNGTDNRGFSLIKDATNLNIRYGSNGSVFSYIHKTGGNRGNLDNASWQLRLIAYA